MTYLQFHLFFNLPPLFFLLWLERHHPPTFPELLSLAGVFLAVGLFTSPWDNAAVQKGIWGFPRTQHCFKIKFLPIEEYLFFFIQSLLVILSVRWTLHLFPSLSHTQTTRLAPVQGIIAIVVALLWLGFGKQWHKSPRASRWNYTYHLFYWFTPLIIFQWILGYEVFTKIPTFLLLLSGAWALYYTLCDLVATAQGIWHFDGNQIHGYRIFGLLPWEESAFFGVTSLLVAQSYLLLLPPQFR